MKLYSTYDFDIPDSKDILAELARMFHGLSTVSVLPAFCLTDCADQYIAHLITEYAHDTEKARAAPFVAKYGRDGLLGYRTYEFAEDHEDALIQQSREIGAATYHWIEAGETNIAQVVLSALPHFDRESGSILSQDDYAIIYETIRDGSQVHEQVRQAFRRADKYQQSYIAEHFPEVENAEKQPVHQVVLEVLGRAAFDLMLTDAQRHLRSYFESAQLITRAMGLERLSGKPEKRYNHLLSMVSAVTLPDREETRNFWTLWREDVEDIGPAQPFIQLSPPKNPGLGPK